MRIFECVSMYVVRLSSMHSRGETLQTVWTQNRPDENMSVLDANYLIFISMISLKDLNNRSGLIWIQTI